MARSPRSEELHQHLLRLAQVELAPHDRLPTERELAETFGVSRPTVRRVLDRLEQDALVYRVHGSGTYVSAPRVAKSLELTAFSEDMRGRRMEPGSLLLSFGRMPAGAELAHKLGLSPADEVYHVHRVRTADGSPMAIEHAFLPASLFPAGFRFSGEGSLYRELTDSYGLRPHHAQQSIRVTVLNPSEAELLKAAPFTPAFDVRRTVYDARDRPIERATSLYRGDRYSFDVTLFRDSPDA